MLSRLARKAFEFAKSLLKSASSNPLLLLDNRFLKAAPRAFESWPEPTCRFWKPARANSPIKYASQSHLADFETRPEPTRRFWKPARAYLPSFQKLFANSKAFCAKQIRICLFNIKLKGQLTFFWISAGLSPYQDPSYQTTFSQFSSRVPVPLKSATCFHLLVPTHERKVTLINKTDIILWILADKGKEIKKEEEYESAEIKLS